jgi:hypothetical protein
MRTEGAMTLAFFFQSRSLIDVNDGAGRRTKKGSGREKKNGFDAEKGRRPYLISVAPNSINVRFGQKRASVHSLGDSTIKSHYARCFSATHCAVAVASGDR